MPAHLNVFASTQAKFILMVGLAFGRIRKIFHRFTINYKNYKKLNKNFKEVREIRYNRKK
jgi:uncharacterized membrane protein YbaN (DUF454 family)